MTCNHDSLWAENGRLKALLKARTDALNRTVKRAETAEATIARIRREHTKGYATTTDEVWDRNAICNECQYLWPCTTVVALDGEQP